MSSTDRKSTTTPVLPRPRARQLSLFEPPHMLEGEDAVHNRELFDQLRAAVRPADCIYEMLIADVAYSQRHLDRLRRWNECLLQTCAHKALQNFLAQNLDDDLYA